MKNAKQNLKSAHDSSGDEATGGAISERAGEAKNQAAKEAGLEEIVTPRLQILVDKVGLGKCNGLYDKVMEGVERPLIKVVLKRTGGNQMQAAAMLGINRNTLRRKIQKLKIHPE